MTRVHWTPQASNDLDAIYEFVSRDSPRYAAVLVARLIIAADRLEQFIESGRVVPEVANPTIRELIRGAYRIVYRVREGHAEILTVHHAARPLPRDLPVPG
ncbi:MAG: type II toxin-antitoxin system RelE/ParE family toxin [Gemmatimonadales bacterium]